MNFQINTRSLGIQDGGAHSCSGFALLEEVVLSVCSVFLFNNEQLKIYLILELIFPLRANNKV